MYRFSIPCSSIAVTSKANWTKCTAMDKGVTSRAWFCVISEFPQPNAHLLTIAVQRWWCPLRTGKRSHLLRGAILRDWDDDINGFIGRGYWRIFPAQMGGRTYMKYAKLSDLWLPPVLISYKFYYETHATSLILSAFWGPPGPHPFLVQYFPDTSFPAFPWEGG